MEEQRAWEPWTPEIGQRVRVRLSAECDVEFWGPDYVKGHPPEFDGLTGAVRAHDCDVRSAPWIKSHPYCVVFDAPLSVMVGGTWARTADCNYFAAIELEPLDA